MWVVAPVTRSVCSSPTCSSICSKVNLEHPHPHQPDRLGAATYNQRGIVVPSNTRHVSGILQESVVTHVRTYSVLLEVLRVF